MPLDDSIHMTGTPLQYLKKKLQKKKLHTMAPIILHH